MFGPNFEQIHSMVQQFDKQYFSTLKLIIDEVLKDLCELTPLSCSLIRAPLNLLAKLLLACVGTGTEV